MFLINIGGSRWYACEFSSRTEKFVLALYYNLNFTSEVIHIYLNKHCPLHITFTYNHKKYRIYLKKKILIYLIVIILLNIYIYIYIY